MCDQTPGLIASFITESYDTGKEAQKSPFILNLVFNLLYKTLLNIFIFNVNAIFNNLVFILLEFKSPLNKNLLVFG